jgi:hypothetical protein
MFVGQYAYSCCGQFWSLTLQVADDYSSFNATYFWPDAAGLYYVHSFPHVKVQSDYLPILASDVTNFTLSAKWSLSDSPGAITNIAWDIFADIDRSAAMVEVQAKYEIMLWLGSVGGPQPLGFQSGPCLTMTSNGTPL